MVSPWAKRSVRPGLPPLSLSARIVEAQGGAGHWEASSLGPQVATGEGGVGRYAVLGDQLASCWFGSGQGLPTALQELTAMLATSPAPHGLSSCYWGKEHSHLLQASFKEVAVGVAESPPPKAAGFRGRQ